MYTYRCVVWNVIVPTATVFFASSLSKEILTAKPANVNDKNQSPNHTTGKNGYAYVSGALSEEYRTATNPFAHNIISTIVF